MRTLIISLILSLLIPLLLSPPVTGEEMTRKERMQNYVFLGRVYEQMGNTKKAIDAYEQALIIIPTDIGAREKLARLYQKGGLTNDAISAYSALIEINPGNISYHLELARAYEKNGDDEEVISECRYILSSASNDWELSSARSLLIKAYSRLGQLDQLIPEIEKSIEAEPKKIDNYLYLAEVYKKNGRPEEMLKTYRQALALSPQNTDLFWKVANSLIKEKKFPEAITILEKLVKLRPGDSTYCYNLGRCYFESQEPEPEKAITLWDTFQAENATIEPHFYYSTGCMYRNYKLYDRSLAQLKKSYQLSDDSIRYLGAIAQTYEEMGDDKNATETYLKVMLDSDTDDWVNWAQDRLIRIYKRRDELGELAALIEGILNNDRKGGSDAEEE
ncbi:MAG: tetratricopeptide repeat protein [Candidatus Euphemobacter frigidus]|nr:tetratricopeptide repeat protein [Candidatus Euphemobacter frigidus]MDP8275536.1 tetratricopeptide repeat protein [Candidatus Euphemobacter frigidus]